MAVVGYVVGLVLVFNFGFFETVTFVFPAWVAFLSIYILINAPASMEPDGKQPATSPR